MPVSSSIQISDTVAHIIALDPQSVLDVGCGFGLWGFLCREYLDVWNGRVQPHEWQVRIDGIELWEPYIQAHQRALYTDIIVQDIREALKHLGEYDVIIAGDVIEHLDKPEAEEVLDTLYEKARKALLVNIPLTGNWDHPIQYGNPGELHRSQWVVEDFAAFPHHFKEYKLPCGEYGAFVCPKDCVAADRVLGLLAVAARRAEAGNESGAVRAQNRATEIARDDSEAALAVTDHHLQQGQIDEGVTVLRAALDAHPAFHFARLALAQLLLVRNEKSEAVQALQTLLAAEGVPEDLRKQALALLEQAGH